jgi:septal ring factor EnvC (AmiA/AmiB activator)
VALRVAALFAAPFWLVAVVALAQSDPPSGQRPREPDPTDHELSAVREGLKAQTALVGEDEAKAAQLVEDLRTIDARLLDAVHAQEALLEAERSLEAETRARAADLERSEAERAEAAAALEARLADIYRRGRLGSSRMLVQAAASAEPLRIARYLAAISQADDSVMKRYDALRREHARALLALEEKRHELDQTKAELVAENANYERARAQKSSLLTSVEKDLALHRATRERLAAIEGELQRIMIPREPLDPAHPRALARLAPADARPFGERKGTLTAPVTGKVRFRYGDRAERGATVRGVVVDAGGDRRVVSVAEGEVVFAGPFPGLGNTIILNHGGRFHTVYAQLASVVHEVGSKVRTNEVIGTLAASDPLLHFELRSEGKAVDPLPWLAGGETAFSR